MSTFARFSEHAEAGRLLDAALREGPAHAYLFHGPPGVGKREVARTFAQALLDTTREFHPDLYELDALGEMIRIDAIRELRRDLHMRPFEADRRIYLIHHAHLMNEDAADALLKDLEEPPSYAVIVLIADDLGPIPETIRSRCQLVPFSRLSESAMRELVDARAPQLDEASRSALARVAGGRLDRLERLLDPASAARRERAARAGARRLPRSGVRRRGRGGGDRRERAGAGRRGARRRGGSHRRSSICRRARPSSACKRAARGAEREELLAQLEELAVVVPRPRRGRRRRGAPPRSTSTSSRELARGRDPRAPRRSRACGRGGARFVARAGGVQPGSAARARGAVPARLRASSPDFDAATLLAPRRRSSAGRALHS